MPLDEQLLRNIGLEPPTAEEQAQMPLITPEEFSIYMTRLELICEEVKQNLTNIGFAPHIEMSDTIVPIFTAQGDLVLGSGGTYLHANTGAIPVKYMMKYFLNDPSVGIREGDIFLANEPIYGGIHTPDFICLIPIFYEGKLIAWGAVCNHEPEVGGGEPGAYTPWARTRWEEGLHITPVKIAENFTLKQDVVEMMTFMVRDERMFVGDMRARAACCMKLQERVQAIAEEKGGGFVVGLLRKVLDTIAEAARARVRTLNDGTYRAAYFYDTIGGVEHALGCAHIAVVKKGDSITVDMSGTSPTTATSMNAKPHIVRALLGADLMQYFFSDIPVSGAVAAPITVEAPLGTWVNAPNEAAMSTHLRVTAPLVDSIHTCFAKMLFESPYRDHLMTPLAMSGQGHCHGGGLDQHGEVFSYSTIESANMDGSGATVTDDGMDAAIFWFSGFGDSRDVEWVENRWPYLSLFRKMAMDQAGAGKYRGGASVGIAYAIHNATAPVRLINANCNACFPASPGVCGYAGGIAPFLEIRDAPWEALFKDPKAPLPGSFHEILEDSSIPRRVTQLTFRELFRNGDGISSIGASAGGYGDPLERDPVRVQADVSREIVSLWAAQNVYGVAIDQESGEVDQRRTERLRVAQRTRRLRQGKPYAEFVAAWEKKRPPEEILHRYGPWPWGITNTS